MKACYRPGGYGGNWFANNKKNPSYEGFLAGSTRLELATSCVTGRRSNQLNYDPEKYKELIRTLHFHSKNEFQIYINTILKATPEIIGIFT